MLCYNIVVVKIQGYSSVGRAAVSKTACPEFESLCPCQKSESKAFGFFYLCSSGKYIYTYFREVFFIALIVCKTASFCVEVRNAHSLNNSLSSGVASIISFSAKN